MNMSSIIFKGSQETEIFFDKLQPILDSKPPHTKVQQKELNLEIQISTLVEIYESHLIFTFVSPFGSFLSFLVLRKLNLVVSTFN